MDETLYSWLLGYAILLHVHAGELYLVAGQAMHFHPLGEDCRDCNCSIGEADGRAAWLATQAAALWDLWRQQDLIKVCYDVDNAQLRPDWVAVDAHGRPYLTSDE